MAGRWCTLAVLIVAMLEVTAAFSLQGGGLTRLSAPSLRVQVVHRCPAPAHMYLCRLCSRVRRARITCSWLGKWACGRAGRAVL